MSGNALRSSAKPSRSRVASSLAAHFSQTPTSIICLGTPALLTDSRTNSHADGILAFTWNSCGQARHTGRRLGLPRRSPQSCMASCRNCSVGFFSKAQCPNISGRIISAQCFAFSTGCPPFVLCSGRQILLPPDSIATLRPPRGIDADQHSGGCQQRFVTMVLGVDYFRPFVFLNTAQTEGNPWKRRNTAPK